MNVSQLEATLARGEKMYRTFAEARDIVAALRVVENQTRSLTTEIETKRAVLVNLDAEYAERRQQLEMTINDEVTRIRNEHENSLRQLRAELANVQRALGDVERAHETRRNELAELDNAITARSETLKQMNAELDVTVARLDEVKTLLRKYTTVDE